MDIKIAEIKKEKTNTELFIFSIVFLLTIIAWIAAELYHIERNKKFTVEYQTGMDIQIEELPSLDVLDKLKTKR